MKEIYSTKWICRWELRENEHNSLNNNTSRLQTKKLIVYWRFEGAVWKCSDNVILLSSISTKHLFRSFHGNWASLKNLHKRNGRKEKSWEALEEVLIDTCHRFGSKPKLGIPTGWHLDMNTAQTPSEDRLKVSVRLISCCVWGFPPVSQCGFFPPPTICTRVLMFVWGSLQVDVSMWIWIKDSNVDFCQHSPCFWSSFHLISSASFQTSTQSGWRSHHQSQLW